MKVGDTVLMAEIKIPILTYHSYRVLGNTYQTNDHFALCEDLKIIDRGGFKIVPLRWIVDCFLGIRDCPDKCVGITFDDGCDLDWIDFEHPQYGLTKSFRRIFLDFKAEVGEKQPYLHASSFVIGSPEARRLISHGSFSGMDHLREDWWKEAERSGIFKIYNHGWDHNHPAVKTVCQKNNIKGVFDNIDTFEECQCEVKQAGEYIGQKIYPSRPDLFAYPYGPSSEYIRRKYFPQFPEQHRTVAAFGASGGFLTKNSFHWNLPRLVFGALPPIGWRTADELREVLHEAG